MKLLVVSGLSGSGKSVALHALEDLGFYCIDNLPFELLPALAHHIKSVPLSQYQDAAVGIDARNLSNDFQYFPRIIDEIKAMDLACNSLFLEADDNTLLQRFSETRRKHPLSRDDIPLVEAIREERGLLAPISGNADLFIDTSNTHVHQLRELLRQRFASSDTQSLSLMFQSFGYKHRVPADADFVFDARCLPNPHWDPRLRALTGLDPEVASFLGQHAVVKKMYEQIKAFLETWIPLFEAENRSYLTVAVGCTGGQHRSVYLVNLLADHFRKSYDTILVRHRELQ